MLEHFGSYWYNPLYCQLQASGHLDVMPFAFDSFDGCLVFVYNLPSHVILLTIRRITLLIVLAQRSLVSMTLIFLRSK